MIAYKFLAPGAVGRFTGFAWPVLADEPGAWVHADAPPVPCARGIHACRIQDLPYWLDDELWTIELAGDVVVGEDAVVAGSGRLLAPVSGWSYDTAREFARACADRARELAEAGDGDGDRRAPALASAAATCELHAGAPEDVPAFVSWMAFAGYGLRAMGDLLDGDAGRGEARRQADWLAGRLGLAEG
jgi:hypothetical protein